MKTDTVLVALDLDAKPELLVKEASDLAQGLSARVVLLTVLPVKPSVDADVLKNPAAHPVEAKLYRDEEKTVTPQLKALAQSLSADGIDVTAHVAHGDIADSILHVTEKVGAGIVMVGTHGRQGIARVALGSVAESVIRDSPVPVVTVREGAGPVSDRVMFHEIDLDGT